MNTCALVIGHKKESPGAVNSASGLSEFVFNDNLADMIEERVTAANTIRVYRKIYKNLPDDINALDPNFIISLHCNSFREIATGTEVLYYRTSEKGKMMAEILLRHIVDHLGLKKRGAIPKATEDRGGTLLKYTNAPCVIAEPFFISNDDDLARAQADLEGLAAAYANAIDEISGIIG